MVDVEELKRRRSFSRRLKLRRDGHASKAVLTANPEDAGGLWGTTRSTIRSVTHRFPLQPLWKIEFDLHDLWYTFARAASVIPEDHPAQDRLATEVILARELGSLESDEHSAVTEDGNIWSDLPYIVQDMDAFWQSKHQGMSVDECCNLAAFMARLVALGVRAPELCICALRVFGVVLEDGDANGQSGSAREDISGSLTTTTTTTIAKYLPAAVAWFRYAGYRLAILSLQKGSEGFSMERWALWHQKLQALYQDGNQDEDIRDLARRGMNCMSNWSRRVGIPTDIKAVAGK
ncbi:hypothetical protein BU16DRAFT_562638 [Lophium mytilinum]|uniref:Uncharacterized protein n=1 Tax=Lophium mytilinum TaxID=390894 RepID=A0A6A6QRL8_9PEZI|nr:hypothetical protein BU16DRAFT_562638 [Lophium mytilinum]